ncbi:hypothetical protein ACP4OV_019158 [Aristida adscensionis]
MSSQLLRRRALLCRGDAASSGGGCSPRGCGVPAGPHSSPIWSATLRAALLPDLVGDAPFRSLCRELLRRGGDGCSCGVSGSSCPGELPAALVGGTDFRPHPAAAAAAAAALLTRLSGKRAQVPRPAASLRCHREQVVPRLPFPHLLQLIRFSPCFTSSTDSRWATSSFVLCCALPISHYLFPAGGRGLWIRGSCCYSACLEPAPRPSDLRGVTAHVNHGL